MAIGAVGRGADSHVVECDVEAAVAIHTEADLAVRPELMHVHDTELVRNAASEEVKGSEVSLAHNDVRCRAIKVHRDDSLRRSEGADIRPSQSPLSLNFADSELVLETSPNDETRAHAPGGDGTACKKPSDRAEGQQAGMPCTRCPAFDRGGVVDERRASETIAARERETASKERAELPALGAAVEVTEHHREVSGDKRAGEVPTTNGPVPFTRRPIVIKVEPVLMCAHFIIIIAIGVVNREHVCHHIGMTRGALDVEITDIELAVAKVRAVVAVDEPRSVIVAEKSKEIPATATKSAASLADITTSTRYNNRRRASGFVVVSGRGAQHAHTQASNFLACAALAAWELSAAVAKLRALPGHRRRGARSWARISELERARGTVGVGADSDVEKRNTVTEILVHAEVPFTSIPNGLVSEDSECGRGTKTRKLAASNEALGNHDVVRAAVDVNARNVSSRVGGRCRIKPQHPFDLQLTNGHISRRTRRDEVARNVGRKSTEGAVNIHITNSVAEQCTAEPTLRNPAFDSCRVMRDRSRSEAARIDVGVASTVENTKLPVAGIAAQMTEDHRERLREDRRLEIRARKLEGLVEIVRTIVVVTIIEAQTVVERAHFVAAAMVVNRQQMRDPVSVTIGADELQISNACLDGRDEIGTVQGGGKPRPIKQTEQTTESSGNPSEGVLAVTIIICWNDHGRGTNRCYNTAGCIAWDNWPP